MGATDRRSARLVLPVLIAVLATAGCGDSADGDGKTSASDEESAPSAASPEGKIRAMYAAHVKALYAQDADKVCETFSSAARKELAQGKSCDAWFKQTMAQGKLSPNRPYIVKVDVQGDRARGLVKTSSSQRYPVVFVKENGQWRFALK